MREVKRKANIGEKIKVVDADFVPKTGGNPEYKNGDILTVIGMHNDSQVRYAEGVSDDRRARVLNPEEYVVLEGEKEMRFKVGDKARVKEGLVAGNEYGGLFFNNPMQWLCGKEIEINRVFENNSYGVRESIYYFNDAMLEPAPFTLSDLKPCMVVRQRGGDLKMVSESKDGLVLVGAGWTEFSGYTDDLLFIDKNDAIPSLDIVEVYDFSNVMVQSADIALGNRNLIWKREEPKPRRKMTMEEICKELGEEIEIVKGE